MINIAKIDLDCFPTTKEKIEFELRYDERKNRKEFDTLQERYQDYQEWIVANQVTHRYQNYIINNILDHTFGIKVCDLSRKLREEYFLDNHTVGLIIQHLLENNRFVEILKNSNRESQFLLFRYPKQKKNIVKPKPIWENGFIKLTRQHVECLS